MNIFSQAMGVTALTFLCSTFVVAGIYALLKCAVPHPDLHDVALHLWLLSALLCVLLLSRYRIHYGGLLEFYFFIVVAPVMLLTLLFLFEYYLPKQKH